VRRASGSEDRSGAAGAARAIERAAQGKWPGAARRW
jgi:hypothetical protein